MKHDPDWRTLATDKLAEVLAGVLGEIEDRRVVARAMTVELVERLGAPDVSGPWPYVAPTQRPVKKNPPATRPAGPARRAVDGRRPRRIHPPDFKEQVARYAEQHGIPTTAKKFDVADSLVRDWLKQCLPAPPPETSIEPRPRTRVPNSLRLPGGAISPIAKLEILDYALTHTIQETASRYSVSQQHIYDWRANRVFIEREAGVAS